MSDRATVARGAEVSFAGDLWTVDEVTIAWLRLRSETGEVVRVSHREFLRDGRSSGEVAAGEESLPRPANFAALSDAARQDALARERHIVEVLTGSASAERREASADIDRTSLSARIRSKAAELGKGFSTIDRWVRDYVRFGPASCIDGRALRGNDPLKGIAEAWLDTLRAELRAGKDGPRRPKRVVIEAVNRRYLKECPDNSGVPKPHKALAALNHLTVGTGYFSSSTRSRRSIAERPVVVGSGFRAHAPGEVVMLDSTPLNICAMDPLTGTWLRLELTVAIDLFSRCVLAVMVSPTTKAIDVATLIFEILQPASAASTGSGFLPFAGVPRNLVLGDVAEFSGGLPSVAPGTVVVDHGKSFDNEVVRSLCARLGISIQYARVRTGADKGVMERFFGTIDRDFFAQLPGYTGPDIYSRGLRPEEEAYSFIHEIEEAVRSWCGAYHRRVHSSLVNPCAPGLLMTPLEMFEFGITNSGAIDYPLDPTLAYEVLPSALRRITHDGFTIGGFRYNGPGLNGCRNRPSGIGGVANGRWVIHYDPDDLRYAYFNHPERGWQTIPWKHANDVAYAFNTEALDYARALALREGRRSDDRSALQALFEKWALGLASTAPERKALIRHMRQRDEREALSRRRRDQSAAATVSASDAEVAFDDELDGYVGVADGELDDLA